MKRAQLLLMGRLLLAARNEQRLSRSDIAERIYVDPATVARWERGETMPHPDNAWRLCDLFSKTPQELGLIEVSEKECTQHTPSITGSEMEDDTGDSYHEFCASSLALRLLRCVWRYPSSKNARYRELQVLITLELEDNTMDTSEVNRREALRLLAAMPIEYCGLSALKPIFKRSNDEILIQCSAGLTACWHLRKGKELDFADQTVSKYIPTLKAMVQIAPEAQRKDAAELLAQCFLLKAPLAWNLTTTHDAVNYAQQAETYATIASNRLLQVTALRTKAAALSYTNQWEQALQATEKAKYLLEQKEKSTPLQPAEAPIPQLVCSYVYAGLATYRAYDGRKTDALYALKKAHSTFFERKTNEEVPIWVDHNIGNLLINDGETHMHLGLYKESINSLEQVNTQYAQDTTISLTGRLNSLIKQVMAEVSRDDKPRDLQWCIDRWTQSMKEAKTLKSQQHYNEAVQAYTALRAAWPREQSIKDLRNSIVHW